jgi:hypothetical protein
VVLACCDLRQVTHDLAKILEGCHADSVGISAAPLAPASIWAKWGAQVGK